MSKISKQTKNRSHKSNVNKEHEHEKIKKCEHEHEKNKEQKQDEKHEYEHKEKNSSINIDDDDKKSKNCWFSLSTQLMLLMYSANSQYTVILRLYAVLQITWMKNFNDSEFKTINA